MLRHSINEFEVDILLTAMSPLLIKDGRLSDRIREDWEPIKTRREKMPVAIPISRNSLEDVRLAVTNQNDPLERCSRLDFHLPGSSIKGAWRSHLERTLRGLTPELDGRVCDPLDDEGIDIQKGESGRCSACSAVLEQKKKIYTKENKAFPAYAMSCPICRLFGNTTLASRARISDGVRFVPGRLIQREHVALNRKNGQVMRGPLKFFALQDARFKITLTVRNYELQHLLLIGVLLSDLAGMRVPLGSGKSKGYGQVKGEFSAIRLTATSLEKPAPALAGVAEHPEFGEQLADDYRWNPAAKQPEMPGKEWKADDVAPWKWRLLLTATEFFEAIKGIKLNWASVPNLAQRLEWEPGTVPSWLR